MPFDKAVESVERFVIRFEVHMVIGYEEISPKALFGHLQRQVVRSVLKSFFCDEQ